MADEVARRLVHASGTGLPALYLLDLTGWPTVQYLLVAGAALALVLEVLRLLVGLDWEIYDRLTREYEQDNVAGYALYFVSAAAVAVLFPSLVAVPAILMLTIGDPISGLLGSGELRPAKQASVLAVMFAVCTAIAAPFALEAARAADGLGASEATLVAAAAAVLGGLAATAADGLKPVIAGYVIDDNLSIPVLAALAMAGVLRYLPAIL